MHSHVKSLVKRRFTRSRPGHGGVQNQPRSRTQRTTKTTTRLQTSPNASDQPSAFTSSSPDHPRPRPRPHQREAWGGAAPSAPAHRAETSGSGNSAAPTPAWPKHHSWTDARAHEGDYQLLFLLFLLRWGKGLYRTLDLEHWSLLLPPCPRQTEATDRDTGLDTSGAAGTDALA